MPGVRNSAQASENPRKNSLLNYKSAALNQLRYAGISPYESCFQRVDQELVMIHSCWISVLRPQKGEKRLC
jgi:hypothetical protein